MEERGATATNPKMVSRQHIGSGSSWRYRHKRELCGCAEHAKDGGVIPVTGFPHDGGKENEERARTNSDMVQTRASHTTHMHSVHGRRPGVIPSKRAFRAERVRSGSSCSRGHHGSSRSRDGSGSSGTRSFSERYLMGPRSLGRR